jgi:hypothetical protein
MYAYMYGMCSIDSYSGRIKERWRRRKGDTLFETRIG